MSRATRPRQSSGLDHLLGRLQKATASARPEALYEDELGGRWRPGYAPDGLPDGSLHLVSDRV